LIFEGPGQGAVIREQELPYRYDWEKVVTPVVDYALSRDNVDPNKVALIQSGTKFGYIIMQRLIFLDGRQDGEISEFGNIP